MTAQPYKALCWDNDGVLVDTEGLYFRACREILAEEGFTLLEAQYREISLRSGNSVFELIPGLTEERYHRLRKRRNALYMEMLDEGVEVLPGVRETLEHFHRRLPMGVVTSCRRDHFERIHRDTDLLDVFDFVITSQDVERTKPQPECYLKAAERHGFPPTDCLAIEDTERGLFAANAAQMPCVAIPGRLTEDHNFSTAIAVLNGVGALPGWVGLEEVQG